MHKLGTDRNRPTWLAPDGPPTTILSH